LSLQTLPAHEIIIVDASTDAWDNHPELIALFSHTHFPHTALHYMKSPKGLTLQRNLALRVATGEFIYFFDDDVILEPTYLQHMHETFMRYPHYVAGMGTITNIAPKKIGLHRLFRKIFLLQHEHGSGNFTASGIPTHPYGTQQFREIEILGGCCMAFRTQILKKHQFDTALATYAYMEDADIACRVRQDGPIFFNPAARLQHLQSPTARDNMFTNRAMLMRNYRYLFAKNFAGTNPMYILAHWWSIIGLFLEALLLRQPEACKGYLHGLQTPLMIPKITRQQSPPV
jgi:GT2 family glycosyltransferase